LGVEYTLNNFCESLVIDGILYHTSSTSIFNRMKLLKENFTTKLLVIFYCLF